MNGTMPNRIGSGLSAAALLVAAVIGTTSVGAGHNTRPAGSATDVRTATPGQSAVLALKKFDPPSMEADAVGADLGPDNFQTKHITADTDAAEANHDHGPDNFQTK
jgi:hypothetical protein